ncbi:hypothetical protein ABPG75_008283 [Micractinium tetrahymenae]
MFSGLSSLAAALQGGENEEEEYDEQQEGGDEAVEGEEEEGEEEDESSSKAGGGSLSFWGVASALTATVKARTAEVLTAVQETDWRAELEAFQQGAKEDAEAVTKGADAALHKAVAAAEHLPGALEHLPGTAGAALPVLQARAGAAAEAAKVQAGRSLANLAGLGSKIVLGTHDLFEQISTAVQNEMALAEGGAPGARRASSSKSLGGASGGSARYSRFDADVAAMQRDSSTYCDEPEDEEDFAAWLAGFDLAARRPDIDRLIAENTFMSELQARIVPLIVEYDAFWTRYFYHLHKLEQKHAQFVHLTQRAAAAQAEEEAPAEQAAAAEEAAPEEPSPAATVAVEQEAEGSAAGPSRPASSGSREGSPATTTISSDGSLASGEHWQVVTSPRQRAAAAAAAAQGAEAVLTPAAPAAEAPPAAAAEEPAAEPAAGAPAVPPPAADTAPAATEVAAADDDALSDWGEEDEAALEAETAAAGAAGAADNEEAWGSDWE